jgi:hypothetical protein
VGSTKKQKRRNSDSATAEGKDGYTEEILNRLVDSKTEGSVVLYHAERAEYDEPGRYTWEPVNNLAGHEGWMELDNL